MRNDLKRRSTRRLCGIDRGQERMPNRSWKALVKNYVSVGTLKMLSVKGAQLEKTFYIALPAGVAADTLPARLTAFLTK